ncbi:hypothetical protein [Hydrogenophaga laconesensis]|uniref:Sigma-E factor negative regulatory protein RseA n=1 Tax=Hydrogenophaga laconesensis TaxID=1805971 RepID=A0ABU1V7R3_9BURK|nr:hypothetical protein [Hydrogenophaga laconesensis]MDR7093490.1 hypothetical protein [Hydrogenophaga laconesensis]
MTPHPTHEDHDLRARLRSGLDTAAVGDSDALEARVLAQWRQRHAATEPVAAWASGATLRAPGTARRTLWLGSGALLAAALLIALATWQRPDPVVEELMQLDVLSEMALGEM